MTRRTSCFAAFAAPAALALFWASMAHADVSVNDIQASAPAHAAHHPHYAPAVKHRPAARHAPGVAAAPTAITVSQSVGSKYATINSALAAIATGGTITVEPGDYVESLALTRPVTITADPKAEAGSVVVESASRPPLSILTPTATVRGIGFRISTVIAPSATVTVDIPEGSPLIEDCEIAPASLNGVLIHGASARPTLRHCVIHGGGSGQDTVAINGGAQPVVDFCTIAGSTRSAILVDGKAAPSIVNCHITGAAWNGMSDWTRGLGIFIDGPAAGQIQGCDIGPSGNEGIAALAGTTRIVGDTIHDCSRDGIWRAAGAAVTISGCDFSKCTYSAIVVDGGEGAIAQCDIHDCAHPGVLVVNEGSLIATRCTISRCARGINIWSGSVTLSDCSLTRNSADGNGGAIYSAIPVTNITLSNCTVSDNSASANGGGISGQSVLINCTVSDNRAGGDGGGLYGGAALTNCTITDNVAAKGRGGGIFNSTSSTVTPIRLMNCTITDNAAAGHGGGIFGGGPGGGGPVTNCIIYGNTSDQVYADGAAFTVGYCDIQGGLPKGLANRGGNIDRPPVLDPHGLGTNGGTTQTIALLEISPCLSAGTAVGAPATDQRGVTRRIPPSMGAFDVAPTTHRLSSRPVWTKHHDEMLS